MTLICEQKWLESIDIKILKFEPNSDIFLKKKMCLHASGPIFLLVTVLNSYSFARILLLRIYLNQSINLSNSLALFGTSDVTLTHFFCLDLILFYLSNVCFCLSVVSFYSAVCLCTCMRVCVCASVVCARAAVYKNRER